MKPIIGAKMADCQMAVRSRFPAKNRPLKKSKEQAIKMRLLQKALIHHGGESQNPKLPENPGFRVALRLPGMTISS
jgi:hypothetical protein